MAKMLMANFEPTTLQWNEENQRGYHAKAFHLVLNKYQKHDGIDPHQDLSSTYHPKIALLRFPTASAISFFQ